MSRQWRHNPYGGSVIARESSEPVLSESPTRPEKRAERAFVPAEQWVPVPAAPARGAVAREPCAAGAAQARLWLYNPYGGSVIARENSEPVLSESPTRPEKRVERASVPGEQRRPAGVVDLSVAAPAAPRAAMHGWVAREPRAAGGAQPRGARGGPAATEAFADGNGFSRLFLGQLPYSVTRDQVIEVLQAATGLKVLDAQLIYRWTHCRSSGGAPKQRLEAPVPLGCCHVFVEHNCVEVFLALNQRVVWRCDGVYMANADGVVELLPCSACFGQSGLPSQAMTVQISESTYKLRAPAARGVRS